MSAPRPFSELPSADLARLRVLFTDLDNTLTTGGVLLPEVVAVLQRADAAGLPVVIVTGGPAGAGETLSRLLPIAGAVAESGAVWFWRPDGAEVPRIGHALSDADGEAARQRRRQVMATVSKQVPRAHLAHDQAYREVDVAFELASDDGPLEEEELLAIESICAAAGLRYGRSSIHLNAWPSGFDKVTGSRAFAQEALNLDLDALVAAGETAYVGDAPNDAAAFAFFPISLAVANIRSYLPRMETQPAWITQGAFGPGFVEVVDAVLAARRGSAPGAGP